MISLRRSRTIARHNVALLAGDPAPLLVLVTMPLVLMAFLGPTYEAALRADGYSGVSGAEQAVPGMAVLFSFFSVQLVGAAFFREHHWGTWERLRASAAKPAEILLGKCTPSFVMLTAQLSALMLAGRYVFDMNLRGSLSGLALVISGQAIFLMGLSMALVALCRTLDQISTIGNLGGMVLSGIGGALAPVSALPTWAQGIAPLSPAYWALRGFRSVILDGGGVAEALAPAAILAGIGSALLVVAARRLRFDDTKVGHS